MPASVSWAELIRDAINSRVQDVHVSMPGVIQTYDPVTQTATVTPVLDRVLVDLETGGVAYEELPTIPDVPIAWPRFGGYFLAGPLAKGDHVTLVFSEVATGDYRDTGQPAQPQDARRHDLSYPVAFPCKIAATEKLGAVDAAAAGSHIVFGKEGGNQIHVDGTAISLGTGAVDSVTLATALKTLIAAACTSAVGGAVAGDGGAAAFAAFATTMTGGASTYKATIVKAK